MTALKQQLYALCQDYVARRIEVIQKAIVLAQTSANEETKSSAGDKYETGRAMAQLEIEKNTVQLTEAMKLKKALNEINPLHTPVTAQPGSLVTTGQHAYYISISAGQLKIGDKTFFAISQASPIGLLVKGLKVGDSFDFNGKTIHIKHIA